MSASSGPSAFQSVILPTMLVVLASIGFGIVPLFAKALTDMGFSPTAVAFYRFSFAAVVLLPFLSFRNSHLKATLFGICAGASLGAGWIAFVSALKTAPVAVVGVVYMTYPIFTIATAWLFYRERPGRRSVFAALMIFAAAVIAATGVALDPAALPALLVSLLSPMSFGIAINILTHSLLPLPPISRVASASLGCMIILAPMLLIDGFAGAFPRSNEAWLAILGLAVATALLPQLIYVVNAPKIGAARSAMCGSVELPTMFAVGLIAFGEKLTIAQLAAGALVVSAIVLTPARATRNVANNLATTG